MSRGRLAGLATRRGWQLPSAVILGAVLVAVTIGAVLLPRHRDREASTERGAPTATPAPWNTADAAYVWVMLWHQDQAREMANLVQARTTRPSCGIWHAACARVTAAISLR
jgi:uncharacterized protein (DUF305 family)